MTEQYVINKALFLRSMDIHGISPDICLFRTEFTFSSHSSSSSHQMKQYNSFNLPL